MLLSKGVGSIGRNAVSDFRDSVWEIQPMQNSQKVWGGLADPLTVPRRSRRQGLHVLARLRPVAVCAP